MGPIVSANWSATYEQLLGKVLNKFRGSQIEMRWLEDNFQTIEASRSTVLATLYREMCRGMILDKAKIGSCMLLFQPWA
ncbi:hypothetical protein J1N35_041399, partial [Gossypium stocksii]